jgi:alpha-mannosidase
VSAVSWIASVEEGRGDGLAVLLEGPQGASAGPEELGVSLLRAPTWPDPGADNGPQRLRLALMPATAGWRASAVPQQACRFREPLWLRPRARPGSLPALAALPSQEPDVQVVGLQQAPGEGGESVLSVQNLGPCRRRLRLGDHGEVVRQLDGLHEPLAPPHMGRAGAPPDEKGPEPVLAPWSLTFWQVRLGPGQAQKDRLP